MKGFTPKKISSRSSNVGAWGNYLVALIFLVIGLYLLDVIKLSWGDSNSLKFVQKKGYWAALLIGLVFGLALGPCTFAYMAPMLGVVFSVAATNLFFAMPYCWRLGSAIAG
jgi:cytochrome c-type biogenesis protein